MSDGEHLIIIKQILHAIEQNDFILPTLPSVAAKIQILIDDPNVSAEQFVSLLAGDPFISAQIIKCANSAIFAGRPPIDNVRSAVSRLGYRQLRNLVMTITMTRMFTSNIPFINQKMKQVWEHSRKVAAISYVLASRLPHLVADQAMLAGLVHDIGVMPVCMHIEKMHLEVDNGTFTALIRKCHITTGAWLLKEWNFPPEIVEVVAAHEDISRESSTPPLADYADIITFANLLDGGRARLIAWKNVAAVKRLGLSEDECKTYLEQNAGHIEMAEELLGIKQKANVVIPMKQTWSTKQASPVFPPTVEKKKGLFAFLAGWLTR